mgnify:CR=1 FL=1
MERRFLKKESRGLPGGPNEVFTYVTGVFSVDGYREDSNDVNKSINIIPSGNITMKERNGAPLKKGPILGIDNLGNKKAMIPGNDYSFPGDYVFEIPMKQDGGEETSWTDYFNPMNWGVSSYDNKGSFGNAFAAARKAGEYEFMWHGNRYTTKMAGEDSKKVVSKPLSNIPAGKGIDSSLLMRQAYRESTFNPKAVSPKGYKGLTQVGDSVIKDYKAAKKIDGEVNPFNAKTAVDIQRYAMNELYNASFINRPNQSEQVRLAKTLAAYNWGRGNLKNHLESQKAKGVDIYNSLAWINTLPKETRDYIDDILLKKDQTFNQDFNSAVNNVKFQPYVRLYKMEEGGEADVKEQLLKMYSDYVDGTDDSEQAKAIYDKLNKVYYNEAKQNKMTVPNYILTKVMGA